MLNGWRRRLAFVVQESKNHFHDARQRRVYVADPVAEKRLRRLRDAEKTQTFPTDRSNFPIGFLWDEEERSAKKGVTLTNGEKQENNDIQQARHVCD